MPPVINRELCTGCGNCEDSCPLDVIYMDEEENKSFVKYPDECWHCGFLPAGLPRRGYRDSFPSSHDGERRSVPY